MNQKKFLMALVIPALLSIGSSKLMAADEIAHRMTTVPFGKLLPGAIFTVRGVQYLKIEPVLSFHKYNIVRLDIGKPWGMDDDYQVEIPFNP